MDTTSAIRLYGVGLGPGDPLLVTLAAVRALEDAALIIAPTSHARQVGRAEQVVRELLPDREVLRVPIPMDPGDVGVLARRRVVREFIKQHHLVLEAAGSCAFVTLGDPVLYSTFSLFVEALSAERMLVTPEVIPGIPAFLSLASLTTSNLLDNDERLHLVPGTAGVRAIRDALCDRGSAIVIYKLASNFAAVRSLIATMGRQEGTVVGLELGTNQMQIIALADAPEAVPYFATLIVPVQRDGR